MFGASHCAHFVACSKIWACPNSSWAPHQAQWPVHRAHNKLWPPPPSQSYCSLNLSFLLPRKSTTFFQKALQFLLMSFLYTLLIATIECEQRMYDEGFIIIIIIIIFFSE
jgi:hypothetical protein